MKQINEPDSNLKATLTAEQPTGRPVTLPEFVRLARQTPAEPNGPAFDWLAFFKKFNVRPKDLLKTKKVALKPAKSTRLASGLTIEKTLEIVDALERALARFKPGEKPFPTLTFSEIRVGQTASGLEISLPEGEIEINRQRELTRLLYMLVTGQELAATRPASQLDALVSQYPHTVNVLRQGWQDGYTSTRQLGGAFGWSLFRWENLPLTDEQIEAARLKMAERPKKEAASKQLDLPPAETKPANRSGFPGILAVGSLLIGLILIVAFLVFSFANPPAPVQSKATVSPTATIVPSPTVPTGLVNTRQSDGVNVTRLNPAYLSANEQKYTGPDALAPGQAVKLNSQRYIRAVNAEWSLGQNVYLTLQDGGWEVWDTASGTRISRRELPDADQYAWVSWSPDGENFAAEGLDGKMRLGTGGRVLRTFNFAWNGRYPGDAFFQGSWSPDSSLLMLKQSGDNAQFQFWTFKGTPQQVMTADNQPVLDLKADTASSGLNSAIWSWSGDSRNIAFYFPGKNLVNIYDTHTLQKVGAISTDWQITLPSGSAFVDFYASSYPASTSTQGNFAWSPDGKYMALQRWIKGPGSENGAYKRVAFVWEATGASFATSGQSPILPTTYQQINLDSPDGNNLVSWSRNDRLLLNSRQVELVNNQPQVKTNTLQVYDLRQDGSDDFILNQTYNQVLADLPGNVDAWWSTDGRRLLVSDDQGYLAIFDASQRGLSVKANIQVLAAPIQNPVETGVAEKSIAPSPDGRWLATFSQQTGPQLRDLMTGQVAFTLDNFTVNTSVSYKWSADSRYLALIYSWPDGSSFNPRTKTVARVWKFDQNSGKPLLLGDILVPTSADFAPHVDWNPQSDQPQLLYEKDQNSVGVLDISTAITGTITLVNTNATKTPVAIPSTTGASLTPTTAPSGSTVLTYTVISNDTLPPSTGAVNVGVRAVSTATPLPATPPAQATVVNLPPTATPQVVGSLSARSNIPQFFMVPREWSADWSFLVGPLDTTRNYGILSLLPTDSKDQPVRIAFQPSTEVKPEKANIRAVAVSPDKRMVALGFDNGLVQLYNAADGKLFQAFNAHTAAISIMSFSPDSKSLATGADDHTVKVFETTNWKNTAMLRGQTRSISFLQWFPDSKTLLSATSDPNSAVMWKVQ